MTEAVFNELCFANTGCIHPAEHLLRAGGVQRYHNEPGVPSQEVATHTWRLICILLDLFPDASRDLIISAQYHDVGEGLTGDLPAPLKWGDAELKAKVDAMDSRYTHEVVGVPRFQLTRNDVARMKVADYLELTDYCSNFYTPAANRIMKLGFRAVVKYAQSLAFEDRMSVIRYIKQMKPKWLDAISGRPDYRHFSGDVHESISELGHV